MPYETTRRSLPTPLADRLRHLGTARAVRAGEPVFLEGAPADALYVIESGVVRIGAVAADGREAVTALRGPGELVGVRSLLGGPRAADARALTDARLLRIPYPGLRDLLRTDPDVGSALLEFVAGRARASEETLRDTMLHEAPVRVANRLRDLAHRLGTRRREGVRIEPVLTQEELARMVGCTRETVNRAIRRLMADGVVRVDGRRYVVTEGGDGP